LLVDAARDARDYRAVLGGAPDGGWLRRRQPQTSMWSAGLAATGLLQHGHCLTLRMSVCLDFLVFSGT
jgi:hypothetical protein